MSLKDDEKEFERAMQEVAADPQIQAECEAIARDFAQCESDGLLDNPAPRAHRNSVTLILC